MNSKGQKFISLSLIISLLILPTTLTANERRGANLSIYKTNGSQVKGELIAVKENSLLLKESASGTDVTAVISDIKTIQIVKESQALKWGGMGLLIGGSCGAVAGMAVRDGVFGVHYFYEDLEDDDSYKYALAGGALGGILGVLIGGITGAAAGTDKTIHIEGKSESEIDKTLDELRKKARVPDFQ